MSKKSATASHNITLSAKDAETLLSGGDDYAHYLATTYFLNLLKSTDPKSASAYRICHAFEDNKTAIEDIEGFPEKTPEKGLFYKDTKKPAPNSINKKDWPILINYFEKKLEAMGVPEMSTSYKNLETLGARLHLHPLETETLKLLLTVDQIYALESFSNDFIDRDKAKLGALISRYLHQTSEVSRISSIFHPNSALSRFGLIDFFMWDENETTFPPIDENIHAFMNVPNLSPDSIVEQLIGKPVTGDLVTADFPYLEEEIQRIKKIIKRAIANETTGINILLSGPAGAGKTELAKAIAKELGVALFAVGENDEDAPAEGKESITSKQRTGKLFQAHAFLKGSKDAILLFDEIEDLLLKGTDSDKKADTNSKIVVNRLLETNPVVTIWAGNNPEKFHESLRQRFSYSVHVDYPPTMMRQKIWNRQLDIHKVSLPEDATLLLARRYMAPARMIANAVRLSASTDDVSIDEIERYLESSSRISYGDSRAIRSHGALSDRFDPDLINYDVSHQNEMGALIDAGMKVQPYALFVRGVRGTGVRSFARYLAEKAVMNQTECNIYDIVAPNPFASPEDRLRKTFMMAHDAKSLLVFSNMDAMALNPESETSDWRDGLAPTFMECLMDHKLPVIAHSYRTNARFPTFIQNGFPIQLTIDPLTSEKIDKALKVYFGDLADNGAETRLPTDLVPADFSAVAKLRTKSVSNHFSLSRINSLLEQQKANRKIEAQKMGF